MDDSTILMGVWIGSSISFLLGYVIGFRKGVTDAVKRIKSDHVKSLYPPKDRP